MSERSGDHRHLRSEGDGRPQAKWNPGRSGRRDNGSSDGSQQLATEFGARVVKVEQRGYCSPLQGGIAAARGRFVLMGDADNTYDFSQLGEFAGKLREGFCMIPLECKIFE